MKPAALSAPGKVLLTGGFLVLDRQHTGLVFGLNARIHVTIEEQTNAKEPQVIEVRSPQFSEAVWKYCGSVEDEAVQIKPADTNTSSNSFVQTSLQYAFTYLHHVRSTELASNEEWLTSGLKIDIFADGSYYSSPSSTTPTRFPNFGVRLADAHKTGLGSSAALVTALTAALLTAFLPSSDDTATTHADLEPRFLSIIHNLAQAAHCAAQGKVGSGFDVAAAVYGSCLYRRFTPTILEGVGDANMPGFGERLHRCVENLEADHAWDVQINNHAVQIPRRLRLVMCDVDCGSATPGMVRKVLNWRKDKPEEAGLLWAALQQGTDDICAELRRLAEHDKIAQTSSEQCFRELKDIISTIRSLVREMTEKSKVPIEPPLQTELLDACSAVPGVIGGLCPGAGGYDAIALLVKNDETVINELKNVLKGWRSVTETGTGTTIGNVSLLGVRQDTQGLKVERAAE